MLLKMRFVTCCCSMFLFMMFGAFAAPDASEFTTLSKVGPGYRNGISTASFIHPALQTVGQQQFIAYYNDEGMVTIGRRQLGGDDWETFATEFTANNLNDGHDVVSFGIDGDGYMHISWGMHGDQYHYARSKEPVTNQQPIVFGPDGTMTGSEQRVTYPQFYNLSGGDLLYVFRMGGSGNGDLYLNRYDVEEGKWHVVHGTPEERIPLIQGRNVEPTYNAYWQNLVFDSEGDLHLTWGNRYNQSSPTGEQAFQTNHNIHYAWSPDEGKTWKRMDGSDYALPITEKGEGAHKSDVVIPIPESSSLMNQGKMDVDNDDRPVVANWWAPNAPESHIRQYMLAWYDGQDWQTHPITKRTEDYDPDNDDVADKIPESHLGHAWMGRPLVLVDPEGRVLVFYMDATTGGGITVSWSKDRRQWQHDQISTDKRRGWEPVPDRVLWERDGQVHFIYQRHDQEGDPIYVLQWDWKAWDAAQG